MILPVGFLTHFECIARYLAFSVFSCVRLTKAR